MKRAPSWCPALPSSAHDAHNGSSADRNALPLSVFSSGMGSSCSSARGSHYVWDLPRPCRIPARSLVGHTLCSASGWLPSLQGSRSDHQTCPRRQECHNLWQCLSPTAVGQPRCTHVRGLSLLECELHFSTWTRQPLTRVGVPP